MASSSYLRDAISSLTEWIVRQISGLSLLSFLCFLNCLFNLFFYCFKLFQVKDFFSNLCGSLLNIYIKDCC